MQTIRPYVLSIGGFDPSGGAGVLADIKTMEQLHVQGMAVLTANTVQTETAFWDLYWFPTEQVISAVSIMMEYYTIEYVKIGIVPDALYLKQIVDTILNINKSCVIIWDPVLNSSSGKLIFREEGIEILKAILPGICLITPNYPEYQHLKNKNILDESVRKGYSILLKGGHREDAIGRDVLVQGDETTVWEAKEQITTPKHGSGCVLSSAITAYLALGNDLKTACALAKNYTAYFLKSNPSLLGFHNGKF